MSEKNFSPKLNRRSLIKAAGAGGAIVGLQGVAWGQSEKRRRVPRTVGMEGNAKTTIKVGKKWHNHLQNIRTANRDFQQEYGGREGVDRTAIVKADKKYGGQRGFKLLLAICSEEYSGDRPDEYKGFKVEIEEQVCTSGTTTESNDVSTSSQSCYYNDNDFTTIYGGCAQWNKSQSNRSISQPNGTTAWEVEYNGQRYIQNAHHLLTGTSCPDGNIVGEMVYQKSRNEGPVEHAFPSYDACLVNPNEYDFYEIDNQILNQDGSDAWPVTSWHTYTSISQMYLYGTTYRKIGSRTGETSGQILEFGTSTSGDCYSSEGIRGGAGVENGDSGAPAFTVSNGQAELVCMISEETGDYEYRGGCVSGYIRDEAYGPAAYALANAGLTPVTN